MTKKTVLVMGIGRFGTALIDTLWQSGAEVIALDSDPDIVDALKDRTSAAFVGDSTDPRVLGAIGVDHVDVAVVTFGEDFEASVLTVASLKAMGVREIVARAATQRQAEVLAAVGASRTVQLETEMGHRVAGDIVTPVAADLVDFAHEYRVVPWVANGKLVGKTLAEADLRRRFGINVLGMRRAGRSGSKLDLPTAEYVIAAGDTLLLVGSERGMKDFGAEAG